MSLSPTELHEKLKSKFQSKLGELAIGKFLRYIEKADRKTRQKCESLIGYLFAAIIRCIDEQHLAINNARR